MSCRFPILGRAGRLMLVFALTLSLAIFGATFQTLAFPHADAHHSNFDGHDAAGGVDECDHDTGAHADACHASPLVSACFGAVATGVPVVPAWSRLVVGRTESCSRDGLQPAPEPEPPRPAV